MKRFLQGISIGLSLAGGILSLTWAGEPDVPLKVATQNYAHTRLIQDGSIQVPGCAVEYTSLSLTELNTHAFGDKRFDVTEVEILPFLSRWGQGEPQGYVLIPVFPLREFQLRDIWIQKGGGIHGLQDLKGKKVAISNSVSTASLWIRGNFKSTSTAPSDKVVWVNTGDGDTPAPVDLLVSQKVEAAILAGVPQEPSLQRLFPNYIREEQFEFQTTRVFPIVTVLAVRTEIVDQNPWLPEALFMAFVQAKNIAVENLGTENEPKIPLPWGPDSLQETWELMGKNYWSYGVPNNPRSLEALLHFAFEQGFLSREYKVPEIFVPSTLQLTD